MALSDSSKEEINRNIGKEILKSGFPLEIFTATVLNRRGWSVLPHLNYYNEQTKKRNELDIFAKKCSGTNSNANSILIIECKKQENKPWIFFEQDEENNDLFTINVSPDNLYGWVGKVFKNHYYFGRKPCAYHFPPFVEKGNDPDVILDAINQVLTALGFCWNMLDSIYQKAAERRVSLLHPVLVLDGLLMSARVRPDGKVETNESSHLQLKVSWAFDEVASVRSTSERKILLPIKTFIIDIVKKDYLGEFLNFLP